MRDSGGSGWLFELVALCLVTAVIYMVTLFNRQKRYFRDRNLPYVDSVFIFGSAPGTGVTRHLSETWDDIYKKMAPHKVCGFFELFLNRFYMIRDPEYAQNIYVNNFSNFIDHGFHVDFDVNPLDDHLLFQTGAKWRFFRSKVTPIFTMSGVKWMFPEMEKCANNFLERFEKKVPLGVDVDLKELCEAYALDVISSTVFGLENVLDSGNNQIKKLTKEFFEPSLKTSMLQFFRLCDPGFLKMFKIKTVSTEATEFIFDLIRTSFKVRSETNFRRKDIIQTLLELYRERETASKGEITTGVKDSEEEKIEVTENALAGLAFGLYMAGYETSSSSLYNLTYFLSVNAEAQEKARKECQKAKEEYGEINFESLKDLKYLDLCLKETLRIFPPLPLESRECANDFTFSNGVTLRKGDVLVIPIHSFQMDPQYYPEPTKFIPERFENPIPKGTYYPFGDGPRACLGKKFSEIEIKTVLAKMLLKFSFHPSDRDSTNDVVKTRGYNPKSIFMYPRDGFVVKVKKL